MKAPTLLITAVLCVAACDSSNPVAPSAPPTPRLELTGEWVRISSSRSPDLDGLVVRISDDGTQAVIVIAPGNAQNFSVGEVKWRNIQRATDTRFRFEDLHKFAGGTSFDYLPEFLEGGDSGDELIVGNTVPPQQWQRQ